MRNLIATGILALAAVQGWASSQQSQDAVGGSASTNQVPFFNTAKTLRGDTNFVFFQTPDHLGVGTSNPQYSFDGVDFHFTSSMTATGSAAPQNCASGSGAMYFDSSANKWKVCENNGGYSNLVGGGGGVGTLGSPAAGNVTFWGSASQVTGRSTFTYNNDGNLGIGTATPGDGVDIERSILHGSSDTWKGIAAPPVSASGNGSIYFDSTSKSFQASQNGGAYQALLTAGTSGSWVKIDYSSGVAVSTMVFANTTLVSTTTYRITIHTFINAGTGTNLYHTLRLGTSPTVIDSAANYLWTMTAFSSGGAGNNIDQGTLVHGANGWIACPTGSSTSMTSTSPNQDFCNEEQFVLGQVFGSPKIRTLVGVTNSSITGRTGVNGGPFQGSYTGASVPTNIALTVDGGATNFTGEMILEKLNP